jgi:nitrite reductase/ring-hydroxylating ferredoxin subunit
MGSTESTTGPMAIYAVFVQANGITISVDAVYAHAYLARRHVQTANMTYRMIRCECIASVFTATNVRCIEDLIEQLKIDKTIPLPLQDGKIYVSNRIAV